VEESVVDVTEELADTLCSVVVNLLNLLRSDFTLPFSLEVDVGHELWSAHERADLQSSLASTVLSCCKTLLVFLIHFYHYTL